MADDIIARLYCSYADPPCEQCTFCAARAEIERLRAERDEWQAEYHNAFSELGLAADEVALLRLQAERLASALWDLAPQHPAYIAWEMEARRG